MRWRRGMRFWYSAATAPRPFPAGGGSRGAARSPSTSPSRYGPSRQDSRAPCTTRTAACSAAASSPNSRPLKPLLSPQHPEPRPCAPSRPHRGGSGYVPICTGCARPAAKRPHPGGVACQHVTALFYRTSRSPPRCSLPVAATTRSNRRNRPPPPAPAATAQALGTALPPRPFQSFSSPPAYVPTPASPMAALRPLLRPAQPTLGTRRALSLAESRLAATALRAALVPSSGVIAASIFPPAVVLGTTYTWNATTFQYEANDPAVVPGAPSNGVRFILYALDLAGQPISAKPIGYADPMDDCSGNTQTLPVHAAGTTTDPSPTSLP